VVEQEVQQNRESMLPQIERAGGTLEDYLEASNQTEQQFEEDLVQRARRAVKVSLILDQIARTEELTVEPAELSAYITRQAEQMGVPPDRLAKQLADNNQLQFAAAEVLRGKAMSLIAERVKATDPAGNEIDVMAAINASIRSAESAEDAADAEDVEDAEDDDEADA
jgi:trigger factor